MTREMKTRWAILMALNDSTPYLVPEQSLFADAGLRMSEPVTKIEFEAALRELKAQRRILCIEGEEGHRPKWKITDNGQARLAELNG